MALFLVFSLGSCDKAEDLADVDIPLEISSENIDLEPAPGKRLDRDSYKFKSKSDKIDLFQGELKEYKGFTDKIRKFKATKIILEIITIAPQTGVVFSDPSEAVITSASGKKATLNFSGEEITAGKKIVEPGSVIATHASYQLGAVRGVTISDMQVCFSLLNS